MTSQVLLLTSLSILWRAWGAENAELGKWTAGISFAFQSHKQVSYNVVHQVFDCSYSQHQE